MIEVNAENAAEIAAKLKAGGKPGAAKSLAEAMAKVMEQVGYVQKTGTMEFGQKYKYAGEAAFIAAIRPELVAQQIVITPVAMELLAAEVVTSAKGGSQNRVLLRVTWRFTHAPTGDKLDVVTCGEGIDTGDKAMNKAQTGAMKYALRQSFVIETGNDPDDTPSATQERKAEVPKEVAKPVADNLKARAEFARQFAETKDGDRSRYLAVCGNVNAAVRDGRLSDADRAALVEVAKETAKRCPEAKQPAGAKA